METDKSSNLADKSDTEDDPDGMETNDKNDAEIQKPTTSRKTKKPPPVGSNISNYQKKKLLEHFKKNGYSMEQLKKAVSKLKIDIESAKAFFNKCMEDAENHVHEEFNPLSYRNIIQWLELLKKTKVKNLCNHETPAMLNAIANNEKLPPPGEMSGIDLKAIYGFLGKGMLGQPQEKLTGATAKFLSKEFCLLIDEANTDLGDSDTKALKGMLEQNASTKGIFNYTAKPKKMSIDPLCLDKQL